MNNVQPFNFFNCTQYIFSQPDTCDKFFKATSRIFEGIEAIFKRKNEYLSDTTKNILKNLKAFDLGYSLFKGLSLPFNAFKINSTSKVVFFVNDTLKFGKSLQAVNLLNLGTVTTKTLLGRLPIFTAVQNTCLIVGTSLNLYKTITIDIPEAENNFRTQQPNAKFELEKQKQSRLDSILKIAALILGSITLAVACTSFTWTIIPIVLACTVDFYGLYKLIYEAFPTPNLPPV